MQNIIEILKGLNIEVPQEQVEALNKAVAENYKTTAEFDKKLGKIEAERDSFKAQAEKAAETLKGFDGVDIEGYKKQIADYQKQVKDLQDDYNGKIAQRDFDDALNAAIGGYKFTSNSAKESVIAKVRAAGLKQVDGKIMGLADYIETIKANDAGAFASDDDGTPPARFTSKKGEAGGKHYASRADIMKIKDPKERQQAIMDNIDLFE